MAIAKKPKRNQKEITTQAKNEHAADVFIAGAEVKPESSSRGKDPKKIPILVRFDPGMLQRVDIAAKRRGISRSAWIHFMVSIALEQGES